MIAKMNFVKGVMISTVKMFKWKAHAGYGVNDDNNMLKMVMMMLVWWWEGRKEEDAEEEEEDHHDGDIWLWFWSMKCPNGWEWL